VCFWSDTESQSDGNKTEYTKSNSTTSSEININGITYKQVNMTKNMYNIFSHQNVQKGFLIDCGTNGGIAGEDVRVINKTGRQVDVQGIDNHLIVDIPVGTIVGIVPTH